MGVNDISADYFVDGYIQNNLLAAKRYDFATKQTTYFDSGISYNGTYKSYESSRKRGRQFTGL